MKKLSFIDCTKVQHLPPKTLGLAVFAQLGGLKAPKSANELVAVPTRVDAEKIDGWTRRCCVCNA